ncbi:MAG: HAD family hydrolase [Candidatus Kariarchaeaceae archaeon]|jgi:FMN phosphatase YigB (HAD superfamily)
MGQLVKLECLLLDLDDTLLGFPDQAFVKHYPRLVTKYFLDTFEPKKFLEIFWKATQDMLQHKDHSMLTLDTFFHSFSALSGMSREEAMNRFYDFYNHDFKLLQQYTEVMPEAKKLVKISKDKNIKVILATNPLFPEIATRERCRWANLDYDGFLHVTHAENSMTVKPDPKYYTDLLEIANVSADKALMVGNDYLFDMGASKVGIHTWLTNKYRENEKYAEQFKINYEGSLVQLIEFIQKI